jgi:hypothetical protein
MGFLPSSGFGAAAGGDMLQQILQRHAQQAFQQQQLQQEQQKIDQANQEALQRQQLQAATLKSIDEERQAREAELADKRGSLAAGTLMANTAYAPDNPAVKMIGASALAGTLTPDQTLNSTNLAGMAGGPITATPNPGAATGMTRFLGTPQQQAQQTSQARLDALAQSDPSIARALKIIGILPEPADQKGAIGDLVKGVIAEQKPKPGDEMVPNYIRDRLGHVMLDPNQPTIQKSAVIGAQPAPQQPPIQLITTTDANGNAVQKFVPKTLGQTYDKPLTGTENLRVTQAKTVNDTGNDLIKKLSDPQVVAALGPVLGRYTSLQQFIGDPPPEYTELAGEIESYALANMGVHGMRSAQGAQQIKDLLGSKQTPASMIGAIKGLNSFSENFVKNSRAGTASKTSSTTPAPTAEDLIKKYGGGGD